MKLWRIMLPIHPTWQFTVFSGATVLGLGLGVFEFASWFNCWPWFVVAAALAGIAIWKSWRIMLVLAILAGLIIGMARGSSDYALIKNYQPFFGKTVQLTGRVMEDPDLDKQGNLSLRLEDVYIEGQMVGGRVWLTTHDSPIRRSDTVVFEGKIAPGFGSFSASVYRAETIKISRPEVGDIALKARDSFAKKVRLGIKDPEASLGLGYLLGQRRALPPDLEEALRIAGLTHIVVASGYNLTILVRLARRLFEKYSRFMTVFWSGLLIIAFIAVAGMSPSMMRAGMVSGLALGAWYFGRRFHPITLLLFVAMITGLAEPSFVWGNLGWQLSFTAFFGVMVLAPLLQRYFFGEKPPGSFRQILGETISAQVLTLPLIIFAFGQFSNVSVFANILVLPLVPLAMLLTFITGLAGFLLPSLVSVIGQPAEWLLAYMIGVAKTASGVSWAQTTISISFIGLIVSYLVIILGCVYLRHKTKYQLIGSNIIE